LLRTIISAPEYIS